MGQTVSTNVATVNRNLSSEQYNNCGTQVATNLVDISKTKFTQLPADQCPPGSGGFNVDQTISLNVDCAIDALQDSIATTATNIDSETLGATFPGLTISTNVETNSENIRQYIENKCADQSATQAVTTKDIDVTACDFTVVQNATLNQMCKLNTAQDIASKINQDIKAKTTGSQFPIGLIIGIVVAVILIVLIGGGAYYYYSKNKGGKSSSKTTSSQKGGSGIDLNTILLVVLVLFIFFILWNEINKKPLDRVDLESN